MAAGLIAFFAARATAPIPPPPQLLRVTYHRGTISGARFLPGGQNFVFSAAWNGATDPTVYSGELPSPGSAPPLPQALGSAQGAVVAVSPASAIAVLGFPPTYGKTSLLSVIPASGGAPRPMYRNATAAAWPPHGSELAIARVDPRTLVSTLEYPAGHVLYRSTGFFTDLRFSAGGKLIAFLNHPVFGDDHGGVAVVDLAGHKRRLSREFAGANGLAWSPNGREVWFTAANTIDQSLYAVSLSGKLRRVWQAPNSLVIDDIAPNGHVLLSSNAIRATARVVTAGNSGGQNVTVRDYSAWPAVSPDGREIAVDD
ncbi:MAG: TolB family protein [Terriglobales bacterium]